MLRTSLEFGFSSRFDSALFSCQGSNGSPPLKFLAPPRQQKLDHGGWCRLLLPKLCPAFTIFITGLLLAIGLVLGFTFRFRVWAFPGGGPVGLPYFPLKCSADTEWVWVPMPLHRADPDCILPFRRCNSTPRLNRHRPGHHVAPLIPGVTWCLVLKILFFE